MNMWGLSYHLLYLLYNQFRNRKKGGNGIINLICLGSSCFSYTILGFWAKLNWTTYIGTRYSFVKVSFFSEQTLMEEDEIKDINTIMPFSLFFYFISLPLPHDLWTDDSHGNCNVLEKSNRRSQKDAHFVVFLSCDILRWWFVNDIQTEAL